MFLISELVFIFLKMYPKVCPSDPDVSLQNVAEDLKLGIECIETVATTETIETEEISKIGETMH